MGLICKHMGQQAASGYTRKICSGCPNRAKILAKKAEASKNAVVISKKVDNKKR